MSRYAWAVDDPLLRFRQCPRCRYDRRGLAATASCPECGETIGGEGMVVEGTSHADSGPFKVAHVALFAGGVSLLAVVQSASSREPNWVLILVAGVAAATQICVLAFHYWHTAAGRTDDLFKGRQRVLLTREGAALLGGGERRLVPWSKIERAEVWRAHPIRLAWWRRTCDTRWLLLSEWRKTPLFSKSWLGLERLHVQTLFDADDSEAAALSQFIDDCRRR